MFRAIGGLARDEVVSVTGGSFFFLVRNPLLPLTRHLSNRLTLPSPLHTPDLNSRYIQLSHYSIVSIQQWLQRPELT